VAVAQNTRLSPEVHFILAVKVDGYLGSADHLYLGYGAGPWGYLDTAFRGKLILVRWWDVSEQIRVRIVTPVTLMELKMLTLEMLLQNKMANHKPDITLPISIFSFSIPAVTRPYQLPILQKGLRMAQNERTNET
jgi:hypothetical protein